MKRISCSSFGGFIATLLLAGAGAGAGCSRSQSTDAPTAALESSPTAPANVLAVNAEPSASPSSAPAPEQLGSKVSSPFQLNLSQSALNSILLNGAVMKSLQGEIITTLPDSTIGSPFSVAIHGIHLDLKYDFNTPVLNATTQQWEFTTKEISAVLTVDSISANETIQAGNDGATIAVTVDAACEPVQMKLPPGTSQASGVIQLGLANGLPTLQLTSFTPVWTPGAWQVTALNCQGAQGFGDLVSKQAAQMLSQVNPFEGQIEQAIQTELSSFVSGPIHFALDVSPSTTVSLTAKTFYSPSSPAPGPVAIQGNADFIFKDIPENGGCTRQIAPYAAFTAPTAKPSSSGNMLSLPLETVQALVTCAYFDHKLSVQFSSSEVPAFNGLVNSWIEDILVWPDLLGYPDGSVFTMVLSAINVPSFTNAHSIGDHLIALDAELPLQLQINAPARSEGSNFFEPYVRLQTDFIGSMKLNVAGNQASILSLDKVAVSITDQFDPLYVQAHHPDQRIWLQPIESAASSFLRNTGLTLPLPTLKVSDQLSLVPESADLDQGNVDLAIVLTNEN